jgi:hypothetical protein
VKRALFAESALSSRGRREAGSGEHGCNRAAITIPDFGSSHTRVMRNRGSKKMNAVLAERPCAAEEPCARCNGMRVIESRHLRRTIRCPMCTTRSPRLDPGALRRLAAFDEQYRLNAAEARRVQRAQDRLIAVMLGLDALKHARIDPDLFSTQRVMQRWGAGEGSGLPAENPDVYLVARLPPLDDRTQEKVSDIVKAASPAISTFCVDIWSSHIPTAVIRGGPYWSSRGERRPGRYLSERDFYRERQSILRYLRHKFERSGHPDLVNLVRALP